MRVAVGAVVGLNGITQEHNRTTTKAPGRCLPPLKFALCSCAENMGRKVGSNAQPPKPTTSQRPAAASVYRVVIEPPRNTAPFGSIINDASLLQALNEYGPVFHLEVKSTICFATFKSSATVETLVAAKTLAINGIVCSTNYLVYNTSTVRASAPPSGQASGSGPKATAPDEQHPSARPSTNSGATAG